MIRIITKISKLLFNLFKWPYLGFVSTSPVFSQKELREAKELINTNSGHFNSTFETRFAAYLGCQEAVSFASGRMGFFALLKVLDIGHDDEVILTGATCAVMVNAVLRVGATPVYADISARSLGTSFESVKSKITKRTRLVVAQHSFGIPCDIRAIKEITEKRGIFLLEDCALAFDSMYEGKKVGLFGDASLFSFDHTKPLNTMIGGMICARGSFCSKLRNIQEDSEELPVSKRELLYEQLIFEQRFCNMRRFRAYFLIEFYKFLKQRLLGNESPFLLEDSTSIPLLPKGYPYPARLPEFLSYLGIVQLEKWPGIKKERQNIRDLYIGFLYEKGFESEISLIYENKDLDIVPLRFVWQHPNARLIKDRLKQILDVDRTWFSKPIVDTNEELDSFGYASGTCPVSESLEATIINLPTSITLREAQAIINNSHLIKII